MGYKDKDKDKDKGNGSSKGEVSLGSKVVVVSEDKIEGYEAAEVFDVESFSVTSNEYNDKLLKECHEDNPYLYTTDCSQHGIRPLSIPATAYPTLESKGEGGCCARTKPAPDHYKPDESLVGLYPLCKVEAAEVVVAGLGAAEYFKRLGRLEYFARQWDYRVWF